MMARRSDNPLRPRSRNRPLKVISSAVFRRYGLRRIEPRPAPVLGLCSSAKRILYLLWNGPWILLSKLGQPKDRT